MSRRASSLGILRPVVAILVLLPLAGSALAASVERDLPLHEATRPDEAVGRWLAEIAADPGADRALLPSLTWWWVLEDGEAVTAAELVGVAESAVGELDREPRRLALASADGPPVRDAGGDPLYASDYRLELSPPRALHGRAVQAITITPLRAEGGELLRLESARVRLAIAPAATPALTRPERRCGAGSSP